MNYSYDIYGGFDMGLMTYIKKWRSDYIYNQVNNINLPDFKPSSIVRKNIVFYGRVQKVGFRLEVSELAKKLELTGWVRNKEDMSVEAEIQGENERIIFLIEFMKSLKRAKVENVEIIELTIVDEEDEFTIR